MTIRYPAPLLPGDRIGVTAPSSGVPDALRPRLEFCVEHLRRRGYDVVVGDCMAGVGVVSAPATARAAELSGMLTDPGIRVVVPPWGGELAVELLPHLDVRAIASSDPTWLVGYSDLSTLLLPLTTLTGIATLHGQNLMDTPYRVPEPLLSWLDVVTLAAGASCTQAAATHHRSTGSDRWQDDPTFTEYTLDTAGTWQLLDPEAAEVRVSGRLIGGCVETVSMLAGTPYGDLESFTREHAPEGLIVYVEAAGDGAIDIARHLWRMRLAGWFDHAQAVLVGRTHAPDDDGFTQLDAVRSVLGDLAVPVVRDVDCGHVPPHLALVNGALTDLEVTRGTTSLTQHLC
ncbi:MAG: LD-carboxypeptidase [Actinomycetota bacterium]|nr:LD-carboxypeptidase [Actinomycetota bacterium]